MQFSKLSVTALFTLLASSALAAPSVVDARNVDAAPREEAYADEIAAGLAKRGFGCPGDEEECHNHVSESCLNPE